MSSSAKKVVSQFQQQAPENERANTAPNRVGAFFAQQIWGVVATNLRYSGQGTTYPNRYTEVSYWENTENQAPNDIDAPLAPVRKNTQGLTRLR